MTQFTIYWLVDNQPQFNQTTDMTFALKQMEDLRKNPLASAIVMCSEMENQVGQRGVDAVVDGVLPNGQPYVYKTGRGNP